MEFTAIPVIRSACERSLQELYPAGVPLEIKERFEREMKGLEGQAEFADDLLLFKELSDAIRQACGKLYVAGMTTNSILIYLLGDHELNPMPAHYYCSCCGFYQEKPQTVVGMDLPEESCLHCGEPLRRDGFSLREEYVWKESLMDCFEYRLMTRTFPLVCKTIEAHYARQRRCTALLGMPQYEGAKVFGMAVFPAGVHPADHSELNCVLKDGQDGILYDCEVFEQKGLKKILIGQAELLDQLDAAQWESGILLDQSDLYARRRIRSAPCAL